MINKKEKMYSLWDVREAFKKAGGSTECLVHELTGHSPGELDEMTQAEMRTISLRDVTGITLLSKEEYLEAEAIVSRLDGLWWLRSPGGSGRAAYVISDGGVNDYGCSVDCAGVPVRPALRLNPKSVDLQIGEKVRIAGHTWTIIPGGLAFCDEFIGKHCFRKDWQAPDANNYEASDVKMFIEGWARENGLLPKEINQSDIAGITLLSEEEYLEAMDIVPCLDHWWWLRSPGRNSNSAAYVSYGGGVLSHGYRVGGKRVSVRPALRLNPKSVDLQIGEKVRAAGHTWTVIPGNLALCDGSIGEHCFREDWQAPDANNYEASDVKRFIESWARENGLLPAHGASDIERFAEAWTEINGLPV